MNAVITTPPPPGNSGFEWGTGPDRWVIWAAIGAIALCTGLNVLKAGFELAMVQLTIIAAMVGLFVAIGKHIEE